MSKCLLFFNTKSSLSFEDVQIFDAHSYFVERERERERERAFPNRRYRSSFSNTIYRKISYDSYNSFCFKQLRKLNFNFSKVSKLWKFTTTHLLERGYKN